MTEPHKTRSYRPSGKSGAKAAPRRENVASGAAPGAVVNRRAADRVRGGHLWVYASDVESVSLPESGSASPPALLPVADQRGILLGTALYSPTSQIALRMVSAEAIGEAEWLELLEARLRQAIEGRLPRLTAKDSKTDSCRLCFSEADNIPGLVVDKYGELVIVQLLVKGLDSTQVREAIVGTVRQFVYPLHATTVLERPDPRIRELEGLSAPDVAPLWAADPAHPVTSTQFRLNGLKFYFDANAGQKTGAFLDQAANYSAAQQYVRFYKPNGRALDVFCYQGGFALHLAQVCRTVTGVDASRASLEVAERNLEANRERITGEVDWLEADAFELLRDWSDAGERFDAIVLDPPAFAKSKRAVEGAMRGYKELNLRAMRMLGPHGLLITCSCSHHVGWSDLEAAVASAAADAPRRMRLLERRGAAPDHPVVLNLPESEYLKCLVLQAG